MTQQYVIPVLRYEPTDPNERLGPTLHPVAIFLARHASSPATLRTYGEELDQLATLAGYASPLDVPWHEWPPQQWHALFEARALRVKPSTLVKTGAPGAGRDGQQGARSRSGEGILRRASTIWSSSPRTRNPQAGHRIQIVKSDGASGRPMAVHAQAFSETRLVATISHSAEWRCA